MLTTSTTSRRRVAAGAAAVTLLAAGGLGLTASSSAAAGLQATLNTPLPAAAALLQAPPAPPAPGTAPHVRRVTVIRNGKSETYEGTAADAYLADHALPTPPTPPAPPAAADPRQARTIVVRPEGQTTMMIVRRANVAPGAPLPPDVRLPKGFEVPANCRAGQGGPAEVIKGEDGDASYTILCARAGRGAVAGNQRDAYTQALASLHTVRGSIAAQTTSPNFGESDRRDALGAVDKSIAEIEADLAALN